MSNVKQLTLATIMYFNDYDDGFLLDYMLNAGPQNQLMPYVKNNDLFICPVNVAQAVAGATDYRGFGYTYNLYLAYADRSKKVLNYGMPAECAMLTGDRQVNRSYAWTQGGNTTVCWSGANANAATPHMDGTNISYMDGHAKFMAGCDQAWNSDATNNTTGRFWNGGTWY